MTVTVQNHPAVPETRTVLAQNSFDTMDLWMLQRYVTAEVDSSLSDEIFSDVSNLIESARQNMSDRIINGEELTYNTLVGITKHVDGRGQCFLHSRRILHDINDCPVVQRQKLLNQLIASPTLYLGLETAQQVMLKEQGIDVTSIESISKHRDDYTDGHKQSGFVELFWSAHVDGKHIVLVSPVSDTSSYAVTGVIPSFNTSNPTPVYLQAGSIKVDQLGQPMILLSHGALINRHISKQLQHFAPILLTDRVAHGDLMDQCLIQTSPELQIFSNPSHTHALTNVDIDSVLLSQAKAKKAQRQFAVKSFVARRSQVLKMEYLSYWQEDCCISRGHFLCRQDKRKLRMLTNFWQTWNLWRNRRSILVNVWSKVVLVSKNIIFNKCFLFWKQRVLFTSKKQQLEQLKQKHILQLNLLGWYSLQQKLKAISFGKKDMKLRQVKQRLEYCFRNWRQWLQQRQIKIKQGKRMLENWRIEKIQKITSGSSSSETTNQSSPELAGKTSTKASLIHIDCYLKWSTLIEHQIFGILNRAMIAWSLTIQNAQIKKLKEIMTCMMVIKKWVKYYYQVLFKRQIVRNQLQYWFDLLKIVTYAQPKKIIRHVSNHAIVTSVFDAWKQHFDEVQHPMQSQQWRLITVHIKFRLYSWYFTAWNKYVSQRIVKPYMLQQAILHYKVEFKFKNMIFQSWKEHTFIYQQAEMFEDHHESNNIHPTSAEEFRQSARYSSLLSKLRRLLTQFRHNRLTNVAWKFLLEHCPPKDQPSNRNHPNSHEDSYSFQRFSAYSLSKVGEILGLIYSLSNSICGLMINLAYNAVNLGWEIALTLCLIISSSALCGVLSLLHLLQVLTSHMIPWWFKFVSIIIVLVTTGGMNLTDFLSQTLQRIKQQWLNNSDIAGYDGQMVAMPAMTAKVLSAIELQSRTNGFRKRLSLLDTGTDAYLRQDERSMHCMIPSNTSQSAEQMFHVQFEQAHIRVESGSSALIKK